MVDIASNRAAQKYSGRTQPARILWAMVRPRSLLSPRPLWGWRRFLLRVFGAEIGRHVHIYPTVRITMPWNLVVGDQSAVGDGVLLYNLGLLTIGRRVTISHRAHLCGGTHDYRQKSFPLVKTPITICDGAWICADAFIGPNVTVGERAIIAARCVAMDDIPAGQIAQGNPAALRGSRQDLDGE